MVATIKPPTSANLFQSIESMTSSMNDGCLIFAGGNVSGLSIYCSCSGFTRSTSTFFFLDLSITGIDNRFGCFTFRTLAFCISSMLILFYTLAFYLATEKPTSLTRMTICNSRVVKGRVEVGISIVIVPFYLFMLANTSMLSMPCSLEI